MPSWRPASLVLFGSLVLLLACSEAGPDRDVILATTTSTQDSGLLDVLVPVFEERTGLRLKTIAVGTGEALAMASRGDADVVLAHAPALERESVAAGFTVHRRRIMHNDFVVAGPAADPARIHGGRSSAEALARIAAAGSAFASRGDRSGTHFREQQLWQAAGIEPAGDWYLETGQGMGATLLVASQRGAYTLSDRGTYLALRERTELVSHIEGDPPLLNVYSVMEVNPERFPAVNREGARAFADFLLSEEARTIIEDFGTERFGEPLFFLQDARAVGG